MPNALLTGISGLRGHQNMLEVVGNNLANLNTTSYKSQRVLFTDLVYETLRGGSGGDSGLLGGVDPMQIGSGSRISQITRNMAQGNLSASDSPLDLALDGDGFFIVSSGTETFYTRAGAFGIDQAGTLVDPATGFKVQRFGAVGEPGGSQVGFQTPGDNSIRVPLGATIPAKQTGTLLVSGNLSASATGPIAGQLSSSTPWTASGAPATAATLLNDLDDNSAPYAAGDEIVITGTDVDGSAIAATIPVTAATTLGDLVAAVNAAYSGATASIDPSGRIVLDATTPGPSLMSLSFGDAAANSGSTDFNAHNLVVTKDGKDADVIRGGVEVFDARGTAHSLAVTFTKQADGTWNMEVNMDPARGTIVDGVVEGIRFQSDGSFNQVLGVGQGDAKLSIQFAGDSSPQEIAVSFGTVGGFDGLTAVGAPSSLALGGDGYGTGSLTSVQVDGDGTIFGLATNGQRVPLAQLAIATFRNPGGLLAGGNNVFSASLSSGDPQIGTAQFGGRGAVRSNQLEGSNVDLALEFTRLIVAQRGFSANARTITVTDQVLQELTNLIR